MVDMTGCRGGESLCVYLLGGFKVSGSGRTVEASAWKLRKAKSMFKLLALADGHRLHREQVMEQLWPELEPEYAANNLHQALFAARRALASIGGAGKVTPQEMIRIEENVLLLDPPGGLWIDAAAFQQAAAKARRSQNPAAYRLALDLYTGELLPEDRYEDWAAARRDILESEHRALLLDFARLLTELGETPAALTLYRQVLDKDPAHEEAVRSLMRLYVRTGQRQEALRQYNALEETLRRELDTAPEQESARLYEEIRSGRIALPEAISPVAVATVPTRLHNLPSPLSSFIGREGEIAQVRGLLEQTRLATLTGPGGVGKTRLSLRVAHEILGAFTQGVWLVELASLADPSLVLQAVAATFDVREDRFRSLARALSDYLSTRQLLLVLDNCEHLVEACARLAEGLLLASPELRILATSREPLGIEGEVVYPVQSLAIPDSQHLPPVEDLLRYDAVRLFVDRAMKVQPGFTLDSQTAPGVAQICARLDGIPLALELAASRLSVLPVAEIAARLDDRFKLLTGGSRTALPRQRTLQASIDWSYDLLSEAERALLRRLSVFAGGCTLEAAEAVCGEQAGEPVTSPALLSMDILDRLTQLVMKSLVSAVHVTGQPMRYHLLETVRQYAQEKLREAGEAEILGDRHLAYYLRFTGEYAPLVVTSRCKEILRLFMEEFDNLRQALGWAFANGSFERVKEGLRLVIALEDVWNLTNFGSEADSWSRKGIELLESVGESDILLQAWALYISGRNAESHSFPEERDILEESLRLFRLCGDRRGQLKALLQLTGAMRLVNPPAAERIVDEAIDFASEIGEQRDLGIALYFKGDLLHERENDRAQELLGRSLALLKEAGAVVGLKYPLFTLGDIAMRQGDSAKAQAFIQEALDLSTELEDQDGIANSLGILGMMAYMRQDFEAMETYLRDSLERFRILDNRGSKSWIHRHLAIALKRRGDQRQASEHYHESFALSQNLKDDYGIFATLAGLGGIAAAEGEWVKAARLMGASEASFDLFTKPLDQIERAEFDRDTAILRSHLDLEALQAAWEEGRQMTLEQSLKVALL